MFESENADAPRLDAQEHLAAIVASSDDAIISKTLQGVITSWNDGARRIFGYEAHEIIGRPITETLIPADRQQEEPMILGRLQRGERVDHFETVRRRKDGGLVEVSVTISPVRDRTGKIVGASKIARDITRQKQIRRELEQAKEDAEAASRAKDAFLSVLSHELRTPLTPVLAAVSFLESYARLPDDVRSQVAMIRRNVETEARLVDDLLDLTRIARGKIQLNFETIDAHSTIRGAIAMLQQEIDSKSLTVTLALKARSHHIRADAGRIQQVFLNLLSNAVKFTPAEGVISITTIDTAGDTRSGRGMTIEIRDSGVGIEPDVLPRLFKPFEQGTQTITRAYGGLGLGLSIVRSLLDMHGGTITATSPGTNGGSTFTVSMDTVPPAAPRGEEPQSIRSLRPGFRILLVEDHSDTRQVMNVLLKSLGCEVVAAGSVKEALDIASREKFDLLVSDLGLPDGSGIDVMRALRHSQHIRGIAVSGFGQDEDIRKSREAGFETHLIKPINFAALQEAVRKTSIK